MNLPSPWDPQGPVANLASDGGSHTLVEGQTFCVSMRNGDISPHLPHGLFVLDARSLSRWELRVNGHGVEPLAVDEKEPFSALYVCRTVSPPGPAEADMVVTRCRDIGQGMRERITIVNHGIDEANVHVTLRCDVDFADLFAVKENRVVASQHRSHDFGEGALTFALASENSRRHVVVRLPGAVELAPFRASWREQLAAGESLELCIDVEVFVEGELLPPRFRCGDPGDDEADREPLPLQRLASWRAALPTVTTDSVELTETLRASAEDLGALRIFDPERPHLAVLAAGAPWFMTVFGRDSILTAWMTLIADPSLARGVLEILARRQGEDVVDATEEEPGKILHEMRFGASRGLTLGGGDAYYGSVDATPLFVMLLGELRRWDLEDDAVASLLPHADRALDWIDKFGDRDGDGYVEYARRSPQGLVNQGWKDSWDAIRFADGALAQPPIALCEVQGYVYAAYIARAHFAREAGDATTATHYLDKALDLRERFNHDFWMDDVGAYALALDGNKRKVDAVASNMGHCLWTGIVDPARAGRVAQHLVGPDLFSGWGVRTLARSMRAYNPVSYHNGSVWPHDNAICAAGLVRYGYVEEAHRIIEGQLAVAHATGGRLPELFAGFDREHVGVPAAYPTSCSPQAWAAASPLLWLRSLLRLDPWAPRGRVLLKPELPSSIRRLRVDGIRVADQEIQVDVDDGRFQVAGGVGLDLVSEARAPLTSAFEQKP